MLEGPGPPLCRGPRAVRHHLRERAGRRAHQPPVPAGQLQRRAGRRHRRPERAGAGLEHLRRGRPHVALQRQRQRAEDADQAPGALGGRKRAARWWPMRRCCSTSWTPRSAPSWCPATPPASPARAPKACSGPTTCTTSSSTTRLRFGFAPSKVAFLAHAAWHDAAAGAWPEGPQVQRQAYDLATIKRHLRTFLFRFFKTSQFKRSCVPNAPKVGSGGSLSPRGDWRAPSDSRGRRSGWRIWSAFRSPSRLRARPDRACG